MSGIGYYAAQNDAESLSAEEKMMIVQCMEWGKLFSGEEDVFSCCLSCETMIASGQISARKSRSASMDMFSNTSPPRVMSKEY